MLNLLEIDVYQIYDDKIIPSSNKYIQFKKVTQPDKSPNGVIWPEGWGDLAGDPIKRVEWKIIWREAYIF